MIKPLKEINCNIEKDDLALKNNLWSPISIQRNK